MEKSWKIIYYQSPKQNSAPVYDFINSLNAKAKAGIIRLVDILEEFGTHIGNKHSKKLEGTDLWELRLLGDNNIRLLYVLIDNKTFLLLHGFNKKKQKTDRREIKTALVRLVEYKSRTPI